MPALASLNPLARSIIWLRAGNALLLRLGSAYMVVTCWGSELLENKAVIFFLARVLDLGFGSVIGKKVEREWFTVLIAAFSTK
jgi:hypothetical protein